VRSFIQQGVDALIVAPNDPDSMAPLLQQAQQAGSPRASHGGR
jgi:rhamnose transport system substrate-binding protein